uniref:Uncharacterized protein n=1 Tax=Arundo donax TaxID=35708 RepID=A0A0A8Z2S5_ARUDO
MAASVCGCAATYPTPQPRRTPPLPASRKEL